MKRSLFALTLALSAGAAHADSTEILNYAVGKTFANSQVTDGHLNADGTLSGVYNGKPYSGTWENKGGQYCRTIVEFNSTKCQDAVAVTDKSGAITGIEFRDIGADKGNAYFFE